MAIQDIPPKFNPFLVPIILPSNSSNCSNEKTINKDTSLEKSDSSLTPLKFNPFLVPLPSPLPSPTLSPAVLDTSTSETFPEKIDEPELTLAKQEQETFKEYILKLALDTLKPFDPPTKAFSSIPLPPKVCPKKIRKPETGSSAPKNRQDKRQEYMLKLVLGGLKLEKYFPIFTKHKINYLEFLRLTEKDLHNLGIYEHQELQEILNYSQKFAKELELGGGASLEFGEGIEICKGNDPGDLALTSASALVSQKKPLRIQETDELSCAEIIQILTNTTDHLSFILSGRKSTHKATIDNDNNNDCDNIYGLTNLCKQIETKPFTLEINVNEALLKIIHSADLVLDSSEILKNNFNKYKSTFGNSNDLVSSDSASSAGEDIQKSIKHTQVIINTTGQSWTFTLSMLISSGIVCYYIGIRMSRRR